MRYEIIQTLKDEDFKRSIGVSRAIFEKMVTVVKAGLRDFTTVTEVDPRRSIIDDADVLA